MSKLAKNDETKVYRQINQPKEPLITAKIVSQKQPEQSKLITSSQSLSSASSSDDDKKEVNRHREIEQLLKDHMGKRKADIDENDTIEAKRQKTIESKDENDLYAPEMSEKTFRNGVIYISD